MAGIADQHGPAALRKRSVTIAGHRTSVSLEAAFWDALQEIARRRGCALRTLIEEVDARRAGPPTLSLPDLAAPSSTPAASQPERAPPRGGNLSSALRVFVLEEMRAMAPSSEGS